MSLLQKTPHYRGGRRNFCQAERKIVDFSDWWNLTAISPNPLLAPRTSGPRDVPRYRALSLLQKDAARKNMVSDWPVVVVVFFYPL
jgi:hypothetical protein